MYQKFTHKPLKVKAWRYQTPDDARGIVQWLHDDGFNEARASMLMGTNANPFYQIVIPRRDGNGYAMPGDWVVKEGGQFRPVSDETFRSRYDGATEG